MTTKQRSESEVEDGQFTEPEPRETLAESRASRRTAAELKAIVQFHTDPDERWKEVTKVTSVSKTGAGFVLSRPCPTGGLVSMVLPMPDDLRAYDVGVELYSIIGLVQYCHPSKVNDQTVYHLGVGFVGKEMPDSYKADPMQSYRIRGGAPDGLWAITEAKAPFRARATARFSLSLPVLISLMQKAGRSVSKENTVTRNISATGASVECSLETEIGDRVKFGCEEFDFYAIAVVRNRKETDDRTTLHLEFVDSRFPLEKISPQRRVDAA
jgi:hypothetical protein